MSSINLLDAKHYYLTKAQIHHSVENGSIKAKGHYIKVRQVPPLEPAKQLIPIDNNAVFETKHRSAVKIEEPHYEELDIADEDYAKDNADVAEQDYIGHLKKEPTK